MTTATLSSGGSRALAVALLVALVAIVVTGIVQPLIDSYTETRETVEQLRFGLSRLDATDANRAALTAELAQIRQRRNSATGLLQAASEPLAAAQLQNRIKTLVEGGQGELRSTQTLPARDEGKFRRISVRGQVAMTLEAMQKVFYQLETASPLLFLDNVDIRPRPPRARGAEDGILDVRFDVSGYMRRATP